MVVECSVAPHVRGLLKSDIRPGERVLRWFAPPEALAPFVQHFWSAQWNVPAGERRTQPILPFPCANLVVMGGRAAIIGVVTRAAIQQLEGIGSALGAELTPGALRAFGIARPSGLRDVSVAAESLLNGDRGEWPMEDLVSGIRALEAYLLSHGPKHNSV